MTLTHLLLAALVAGALDARLASLFVIGLIVIVDAAGAVVHSDARGRSDAPLALGGAIAEAGADGAGRAERGQAGHGDDGGGGGVHAPGIPSHRQQRKPSQVVIQIRLRAGWLARGSVGGGEIGGVRASKRGGSVRAKIRALVGGRRARDSCRGARLFGDDSCAPTRTHALKRAAECGGLKFGPRWARVTLGRRRTVKRRAEAAMLRRDELAGSQQHGALRLTVTYSYLQLTTPCDCKHCHGMTRGSGEAPARVQPGTNTSWSTATYSARSALPCSARQGVT